MSLRIRDMFLFGAIFGFGVVGNVMTKLLHWLWLPLSEASLMGAAVGLVATALVVRALDA